MKSLAVCISLVWGAEKCCGSSHVKPIRDVDAPRNVAHTLLIAVGYRDEHYRVYFSNPNPEYFCVLGFEELASKKKWNRTWLSFSQYVKRTLKSNRTPDSNYPCPTERYIYGRFWTANFFLELSYEVRKTGDRLYTFSVVAVNSQDRRSARSVPLVLESELHTYQDSTY